MATSIVPKSAFRKCEAVIHGYAELPAVELEDGIGWAMPGCDEVIRDMEAAKEAAKHLDKLIRSNVQRTGRVLH